MEMLKQFKYRQLVFIHSSDTDGRALLGRFQTKTQDLQTDDQEVKVSRQTQISRSTSLQSLIYLYFKNILGSGLFDNTVWPVMVAVTRCYFIFIILGINLDFHLF